MQRMTSWKDKLFLFWQSQRQLITFGWADFQSESLSRILMSAISLYKNNIQLHMLRHSGETGKIISSVVVYVCILLSYVLLLQYPLDVMLIQKAFRHSKFISIFIVFRNPRIKSFLLFFPLPFTTGRNGGQARRHAFPSRRDALQGGLQWRRGTEIHKVLLSTVFLF